MFAIKSVRKVEKKDKSEEVHLGLILFTAEHLGDICHKDVVEIGKRGLPNVPEIKTK